MPAPGPANARQAHPRRDAFTVRAPGCVTLIGDLTDTNDGHVLSVAIEQSVRVHVRRLDDQRIVLRSPWSAEPARFGVGGTLESGNKGWDRVLAGVIADYQALGWDIPGFEAGMESSLPVGAGLGSGAVAIAVAIETLCGRSLPAEERALRCPVAEHAIAVIGARAGHALLLDCRSRGIRQVPLVGCEVAFLVLDSGVTRSLADHQSAARRSECLEAARALGKQSLRDVDETLWRRWQDELPAVLQRRASHVLSENARALACAAALEAGNWLRAGELMLESHRSLAGDYEVSCPEVDALHAMVAAQPGVFGCRMTVGGRGRCVVALVEAARAETIAAAAVAGYHQATGHAATAFVTTAAAGAGVER